MKKKYCFVKIIIFLSYLNVKNITGIIFERVADAEHVWRKRHCSTPDILN